MRKETKAAPPNAVGSGGDALMRAFEEFKAANDARLEAIERNIAATPPEEFLEVSFNADRAGVAMRRHVKALAEREVLLGVLSLITWALFIVVVPLIGTIVYIAARPADPFAEA